MANDKYVAERRGDKTQIQVACTLCRQLKTFSVPAEEFTTFRRNPQMKIQQTLKSATPGERELLISGFCDDCFKATFAGEES